MLWIGAVFGALFGWVGILVAALFWATLAILKLLWALTLFAAQLIIGVSALIARGIIWAFRRITQPSTTQTTSPRRRAAIARTRTSAPIPKGLTPTRVRRSKKAKR
jgi:hypothetical protein